MDDNDLAAAAENKRALQTMSSLEKAVRMVGSYGVNKFCIGSIHGYLLISRFLMQLKLDRQQHPDGHGFFASPGRLEQPLLDRVRGRAVEVGMAGGFFDHDLSDLAVLQDAQLQERDALDTRSSGGVGVTRLHLITAQGPSETGKRFS
jgi:hypothetical protein